MDRPLCLMLIFFGGGLGSLIRVGISPDSSEPFMWANIIACILAGNGYALTRYKIIQNQFVTAFYTIGFLGGLSTFTPLVLNSINRAETVHGLLSIGYLFFDIVAYTLLSGIFYFFTALYLKKVKKMQPPPNIFKLYQEAQAKREALIKEQELIKAKLAANGERSKKQNQRKAQQDAALRKNKEKKERLKQQKKSQYEANNQASDLQDSELKKLEAAKTQVFNDNSAASATIAEAGLRKEQEEAALKAHEEAKRAALEAYERVLKEKLSSMESGLNANKEAQTSMKEETNSKSES